MTLSKFIRKLFHLKDMIVKEVQFSNYNKELHLEVKPLKCGLVCPHCGRRCPLLNETSKKREWRDLCVSGTTLYFHYKPREILCPTHGRVQEKIPWADPYSRISYRLEFLVLRLSQMMSQKAAALILNIAKSTYSETLHRLIQKLREGHRIRSLKSIGIDEISYCKGKKYATIVYDLERSVVVWIGKGKGRGTIDTFFKNHLSPYQKKKIRFASCDMAQAYLGAIKDHCPDAKLVIDKFHIVKALHDAMDELRKEEWRKVDGEEKKAMHGLRWLLFKHSKNRNKGETQFLNALKKSNRRIHRAWVLKDEFEAFWNYQYQGPAEKFLKGWMMAVNRSRLEPLKKFVRTLKNHWDNIITYVKNKVTNAVAEGVNRVIRFVKERASGYSNLNAFCDIIYLVIGDVDLPAQIPAKFRTI